MMTAQKLGMWILASCTLCIRQTNQSWAAAAAFSIPSLSPFVRPSKMLPATNPGPAFVWNIWMRSWPQASRTAVLDPKGYGNGFKEVHMDTPQFDLARMG